MIKIVTEKIKTMKKKFIKIEWDEVGITESHSDGLKTAEVFGVMEVVKMYLWGHKTLVED